MSDSSETIIPGSIGSVSVSRSRWLIAAVIAVLAVLLALVLALVLDSGSETTALQNPLAELGQPDRTPAPASLVEQVAYDSLEQMQASSDLVVEGTVVDIQPGRIVGPVPVNEAADSAVGAAAEQGVPDGDIQFNEVTVQIDSTLGGTDGDQAPSTVTLEEEANIAIVAPSAVGDAGIYFLTAKEDGVGDFYRLSSSQGRFLETATGELESSNPETAWAREAEGQSAAEMADEIEGNQAAIESGEIKPARPLK